MGRAIVQCGDWHVRRVEDLMSHMYDLGGRRTVPGAADKKAERRNVYNDSTALEPYASTGPALSTLLICE